ncbi:MAG: D-alanyl-D-alanine carboxypeptidase [Clostridiales bacterium]|jgi:D-alanyl-D-alanine carboxypeptidase (penicillin-binding protein 5/6)|nr:D-alanyl-D-alanine carboxypeptidase [Clostridiales bacterium]
MLFGEKNPVRKISFFTLTLLLLVLIPVLTGLTGVKTYAADIPSLKVSAKAAVLMEPYTGKVLLEQNPHEKLPPASVTKIMTILLIYEALEDGKIKMDDIVTVSAHAASMGGSQVYLEEMEQQSVRDLLKSVVVASANDSSVALAEFISGSEEGFVASMNEKAKSLGMADTNFVNSCGLPAAGHLTSAYDIALMSRELITKYPQVYELTQIWMDKIIHRTARGEEEFGLSNTNRLIKSYSGATGLKTGSTKEALYCLSATAQRDDLNLISVVLAAPDSATRFHEAMRMLDYGFANYKVQKGDEAGKVMGKIRVFKGEVLETDFAVKTQISTLIGKSNSIDMQSHLEVLDAISAPCPAGSKAGEIVYTFDGKEVGRSDLITTEDIKRVTLPEMMQRLFYRWFY